MDSSVISFDGGADSDAFSPEVKKAKAVPKKAAAATKPKAAPKAAPKKATQTTLKTIATKKRAKPDSEDEENTDQDDDSLLSKQSGTPPNAKKQKVAPVKKSSGKPLGQIDNESYDVDSVAEGRPASAKKNKTGTEQYQKVRSLYTSFPVVLLTHPQDHTTRAYPQASRHVHWVSGKDRGQDVGLQL